jgi:hypothetical protein
MFFSGALNIALAQTLDPIAWSVTLSVFGLVSKLALFGVTYVAIRAKVIAVRNAVPAASAALTPPAA